MSSAIPKPEYPRPDRDRSDRWLSLNGRWAFESEDGETTILVPFAWETAASGVQRTWLEKGVYRRRVQVPSAWADARIVLCFGAVHHRARVLIDGVEVGEHVGGYTSFEMDVTDLAAPGAEVELTVDVDAPADKRSIPHGKQRSIPRDDYDGVSFTPGAERLRVRKAVPAAALALACASRSRWYLSIVARGRKSIRSTSNSRVAFGGIGPLPLLP